jgi:hypothetical protein
LRGGAVVIVSPSLPPPPLLCLPQLLCTPSLLPSLPLSLLLSLLSPWHHPHAAPAANDKGGEHAAPPQLPPLSFLVPTWGGEHAHHGPLLLPPSTHCCHIPEEDQDHCGISVGGGSSPPPPSLPPLPPARMGGVAVDVYWHDQLKPAHGLADWAPVLMIPPGTKYGAALVVVDAWLQLGVEARPVVEVATAGCNRLVGHRLEAGGA